MANRNIHIHYSTSIYSSRVQKETSTLLNERIVDEIYFFCLWTKAPIPSQMDKRVQFTRHKTLSERFPTKNRQIKRLLAYFSQVFFSLHFVAKCIRIRPKSISVHNPLMLPAGFIASKLTGGQLIYVPHELETHRMGLQGAELALTKRVEKHFIRYAKAVTVVCEPIKEWYEEHYDVKDVEVVANIPYHPSPGKLHKKTNLLREKFEIPEDDLIFIYQGFLTPLRGIAHLIEAFEKTSANRHLVLMGFGDMEEEVKKAASKNNNIHFQPAVPLDEIIQYTSSADVGIWFCKEMPLSMQYALPNKFFEYTIAGLYLMVSENFVEQARIIEKEGLGTSIPVSIDELVSFANNITRGEIEHTVQQSSSYRSTVSWSNNIEAMKRAYSKS